MSKLDDVRIYGKSFKGALEMEKYLEGKKLTPLESIRAKCYDCLGYMVDGGMDCEIPDCSLYPFMPYGKIKRKNTRILTDEQRKEMGVRLRKSLKRKEQTS